MSTSSHSDAPLLKGDDLDLAVEYAPRSRKHKSRRSPLGIVLGALTVACLLVAVLTYVWSGGHHAFTMHARPSDLHSYPTAIQDDASASQSSSSPPQPSLSPQEQWKSQVSQCVVGEPTPHFQDNLRTDMEYVTSWVSGGWTNDFMTYINMIYLGLISSRTPIIPPFAPSHVDFDAGYPPFGDVFDVPRLAAAINSPLLEWRDVKQENSSETDQIGCWTIWGLVGSDDGSPRESIIPQKLKLDIAYTALPPSSPRIEEGQHGLWMPFWTLAKLGFSWRRGQALAEDPPKTPAPQSGEHILPDERLLCFDFMYFIGAQDSDEWWFPWSPAWRLVGRHTHWEPRLERLALGYIQRALDLPEDSDKFPPYIAVHVRRGDFTAACGHTSPDECFQPISSYARRVADVSAKLFAKHGLELPMHHVLVTSDETDPAWWRGVDELGWRRADHVRERTEERFGKWYPPLIDAVVQSMAVGFVGTDQSTMSLVALRRVEEWQQGVAELVRIGQRGMEEH